jgi:hypothetical protein
MRVVVCYAVLRGRTLCVEPRWPLKNIECYVAVPISGEFTKQVRERLDQAMQSAHRVEKSIAEANAVASGNAPFENHPSMQAVLDTYRNYYVHYGDGKADENFEQYKRALNKCNRNYPGIKKKLSEVMGRRENTIDDRIATMAGVMRAVLAEIDTNGLRKVKKKPESLLQASAFVATRLR